MKNFRLIFLVVIAIFSGCEEDENILELEGIWVEKTMAKDTLVFNSPEYDFGKDWFELRKENMVSTGPYEYELFSDSISIHWFLSGSMTWQNYYFKMTRTNREFMIGRFYDSEELRRDLLSFVRVD